MKLSGQRIIARIRYSKTVLATACGLIVRRQAYLATLRQEPEFADRSAGDIVSRLSVDSNILGDSVTSNLSDGLRYVEGFGASRSKLKMQSIDIGWSRRSVRLLRGTWKSLIPSVNDVLDISQIDVGHVMCSATSVALCCEHRRLCTTDVCLIVRCFMVDI